jgi:hypothetical protein
MRWQVVLAVGLTLSAAGCAGVESHVRKRAAADFHCSEDKVTVIDREENVVRVAGCGEQATYICTDGASMHTHCKRADWDQHESAGVQPQEAQPAAKR